MSSPLVTEILAAVQTVVDAYWAAHGPAGSTAPTIADTTGMFSALFDTNLSHVVDLSSAAADYDLAVGEMAVINFTLATDVLLHIATGDGTLYEMTIDHDFNYSGLSGVGNPSYLYPNNVTTYGNVFYHNELVENNAGFASSENTTYPGFRVSWGIEAFSRITIANRTGAKRITGLSHLVGPTSDLNTLDVHAGGWVDDTTVWSSLGTLWFPAAASGTVNVRRLR